MLYFSPLKTALIIGACVLGLLLSLPNLVAAPAAWVPWRTIHLGLDLKGGSYLLLEVDMAAVIKERLDSLADSARQGLRRAGVAQFTVTPEPQQNRMVVRINDPALGDKALAALKELAVVSTTGLSSRPDLDYAVSPGQIIVTLSPVALNDRATLAV